MSTQWMPFTAHFRIVPDRAGKRWEHMRDLQKLAYLIYQGLNSEPTLNLALPGGGQAANYGPTSDLVYGTMVKPQFGETPAQATITGFWSTADMSNQALAQVAPQPQTQLISANQWRTGPHNQAPHVSGPGPIIEAQVKELSSLLEGLANSGLPSHYPAVTIFRLDYANVIFGDRGRSFPR